MTKQLQTHMNLWKKLLIALAIILTVSLIAGVSFVLIVTADARLDLSKLTGSRSPLVIEASDGTRIDRSTASSISIDNVNQHTKDAFIAIEDKRFLKHHGIDVKRVGGAILHNLKSGKNKQGASTITQQLVKNTHLSPEKTLTRKMKEMKIASQVEKKLSKDEILEAYLNNIYFGNGCTGIESAAKFYFGKTTRDLSIAESAMLAGVINAPSATEPKRHFEKANRRKNLVLSQMRDQNLITEEEFEKSKNEELKFVFCAANDIFESYNKCVKDEALKILNIDADALEKNEYIIETYANTKAQHILESHIKNLELPMSKGVQAGSFGSVVVDEQSGGVKALFGKGNFDFTNNKRQPASTLKPLLVYGPALEEKIVTPESFVLDKQTDFAGYKPKNAGDSYLGWINVRTALARSKNVPAVKLLDMVGIEKAKTYCTKAGISFGEKDNNLALALGGMQRGTTITELAGAYTAFPDGKAKSPAFIKSIKTKDGNFLYVHSPKEQEVFSPSTAYLVTDMLVEATKTGTAKKLADVDFCVASKTGTIGFKNVNTDCYNVSFTTQDVMVSLLTKGDDEVAFDSNTNGATLPTEFAKQVLCDLYRYQKPPMFNKPDDVQSYDLDSRALEKFELKLASKETPERYKIPALFDVSNHPTEFYESASAANLSQNKQFLSLVTPITTKDESQKDSLATVLDNIFSTFS